MADRFLAVDLDFKLPILAFSAILSVEQTHFGCTGHESASQRQQWHAGKANHGCNRISRDQYCSWPYIRAARVQAFLGCFAPSAKASPTDAALGLSKRKISEMRIQSQ